jgi:hypothetical protein
MFRDSRDKRGGIQRCDVRWPDLALEESGCTRDFARGAGCLSSDPNMLVVRNSASTFFRSIQKGHTKRSLNG